MTRQGLKHNDLTHTTERPWKCEEPACNKTFKVISQGGRAAMGGGEEGQRPGKGHTTQISWRYMNR